jgi:hypothetical protein
MDSPYWDDPDNENYSYRLAAIGYFHRSATVSAETTPTMKITATG